VRLRGSKRTPIASGGSFGPSLDRAHASPGTRSLGDSQCPFSTGSFRVILPAPLSRALQLPVTGRSGIRGSRSMKAGTVGTGGHPRKRWDTRDT
jgi:hypothetical protein